MESTFKWILVILAIIQIALASQMGKIIRNKYEKMEIKNLEGLIKWEKITSALMGVLILLFATINFSINYKKYSTVFMGAILVLMIVTHIGRKRLK